MQSTLRVALVGDYNPEVKAHRAIPLALEIAAKEAGVEIMSEWVPTERLDGDAQARLQPYSAIWVVPASPYMSMQGALSAIRYARENNVPFLGTCGGFQHTLIEYARDVLGIEDAEHAETSPDASRLFISPLTCSLRDVPGPIRFNPGSRIAAIYGTEATTEEYNCAFGLNPEYRSLLERSALKITANDDASDARVVELSEHPFFIATLYQPERSALKGEGHPLIAAYIAAAKLAATPSFP